MSRYKKEVDFELRSRIFFICDHIVWTRFLNIFFLFYWKVFGIYGVLLRRIDIRQHLHQPLACNLSRPWLCCFFKNQCRRIPHLPHQYFIYKQFTHLPH